MDALEQFKDRYVSNGYYRVKIEPYPKTPWGRFKRFLRRTFDYDLLVGLKITFKEMVRFRIHTIQYPKEKLPISPRYRAVHKLLRLLESGNERCIGCGLCEKICISNCIRIDTKPDEHGRKIPTEYTINFGRCIFCGYCAEVCPELAIVHGQDYEHASEQRAQFALKEDMLTPLDKLKEQKEFPGFGAPTPAADKLVKKTPLAY
jgi:NADH-quinone oxidoreductase subunit I